MPSKIRSARVKVEDLKTYPGNARRGDLDVIKESLETHGQYRSIVVQESTGYVLAGNHTWMGMKDLGWDECDVDFIDVDEDQARKIVVVDNRSNDLAEYDNQALADLLSEMDTLEGTGFNDKSLAELLASLGPGGFKKAELDMVIKLPPEAVTQRGEVIRMGAHWLFCCDSLNTELDVTADMVWTDPPYLIEYQVDLTPEEAQQLHRRTDGKEIANEKLTPTEAYAFRNAAAALIKRSLGVGDSYYLFVPPGPDQADWINALDANDLRPHQILQWVKDQFVFGRSDYHYRSEPILYGWKPGAAHDFYGGRGHDSVWEFDRPKRSADHPTIKPVELAIRAVENSSSKGQVVFDPFAGSGTILTACMQTGRRAVMAEIDPCYCDVIIERYERLSGEKVIRNASAE